MKILTNQKGIEDFLSLLKQRASGDISDVKITVKNILADVRKNGDTAIKKYTKLFDKHSLPLEINSRELNISKHKVSAKVLKAIKTSANRIRAFHERQRERSWSFFDNGALLGQIIKPLERVGVYIPGGKASYPLTVLMNVIPAQIAGVREIILCVPTLNGETNPFVMAAINFVGIKEVYRIGGAQAIGAMAFGTKSIKKVDKIVGPGNSYVVLAKKEVFGEVDIDMLAGPSEILIIADDSANPMFVVSDMLSQAEHDEFASSILITTSQKLITKVKLEIGRQLDTLKRKVIAQKSLERFGAIIKVRDIQKGFDISNQIAPEHLEVMLKDPDKYVDSIKNAGAIFLGQWTPESIGDYAAGPNHTLPTGGTARFFSPLGVYDFLKRMSLLKFNKKSFFALSDIVETLADIEDLGAHSNTIKIRRQYCK